MKKILSTDELEKLIKKSFEVHPIKTVLRLHWFLLQLENKGIRSVSVRNVRIVIKSYLKKKNEE